jgi:ParB/RepB/Spo0J family partition protein
MTDAAGRAYDFRLIPIAFIDPPAVSMRESMDDRKLEELAADIRTNGLRQPLGVRPIGDRFRVSYGHRRRIASEMAGELVIPCFVLADDDDQEEEFKVAENWLREETNAAEEATYFAHLLEHKYAGNIEEMCQRLNLRESRINGRLDLLRGDPAVFAALRAKRINLAVARELNKIRHDALRAHRLADAIDQGATAGTVQRWRIADERFVALQDADARGAMTSEATPGASPITSVQRCVLCGLDDDQHTIEYVAVHRDCHSQHLRLRRAAEQRPA